MCTYYFKPFLFFLASQVVVQLFTFWSPLRPIQNSAHVLMVKVAMCERTKKMFGFCCSTLGTSYQVIYVL